MNDLVFTLDAIKKVYLNAAADLSELSTKLEEEIDILEASSGKPVPLELLSLCKLATSDIKKNNIRCFETARLQNKISPPTYSIPKWKTVPYLRRVK